MEQVVCLQPTKIMKQQGGHAFTAEEEGDEADAARDATDHAHSSHHVRNASHNTRNNDNARSDADDASDEGEETDEDRKHQDVLLDSAQYDMSLCKAKLNIELHNQQLRSIQPGRLNVATITIMCMLSQPRVNLFKTNKYFYKKKVQEYFQSKGITQYTRTYPGQMNTEAADGKKEKVGNNKKKRSERQNQQEQQEEHHDNEEGMDVLDAELEMAFLEDGDPYKEELKAFVDRKSRGVPSSDNVKNKKKKKTRTFQNAVIVRYPREGPDRNNKAIKIFCNGSLHVTGCKSVEECTKVCDIVCGALDLCHRVPHGTFRITSFNIQLINTNFVTQHRYNLPKLQRLLFMEHDLDACYDPYFHAALNLKFNIRSSSSLVRDVTILTFHSGNIIITGVVTAHELEESYKFITTFLDEHIMQVTSPVHEVKAAMTRKKRAAAKRKNRGYEKEEDHERGPGDKADDASVSSSSSFSDDADEDGKNTETVETGGGGNKKKKRCMRVVCYNGYSVYK